MNTRGSSGSKTNTPKKDLAHKNLISKEKAGKKGKSKSDEQQTEKKGEPGAANTSSHQEELNVEDSADESKSNDERNADKKNDCNKHNPKPVGNGWNNSFDPYRYQHGRNYYYYPRNYNYQRNNRNYNMSYNHSNGGRYHPHFQNNYNKRHDYNYNKNSFAPRFDPETYSCMKQVVRQQLRMQQKRARDNFYRTQRFCNSARQPYNRSFMGCCNCDINPYPCQRHNFYHP